MFSAITASSLVEDLVDQSVLQRLFGGHIVENNDIFDTVRETGDHGPFNSWGRDRFWSLIKYDHMGLYGAEKFPYAKLDAVDTTVLRHNRIQGNRGFGIDLDDGSTNYEITNEMAREEMKSKLSVSWLKNNGIN